MPSTESRSSRVDLDVHGYALTRSTAEQQVDRSVTFQHAWAEHAVGADPMGYEARTGAVAVSYHPYIETPADVVWIDDEQRVSRNSPG